MPLSEAFNYIEDSVNTAREIVAEQQDAQTQSLNDLSQSLDHANPADITTFITIIDRVATDLAALNPDSITDPLKQQLYTDLKIKLTDFLSAKITQLEDTLIAPISELITYEDYLSLTESLNSLVNSYLLDVPAALELLPVQARVSFRNVSSEQELGQILNYLQSTNTYNIVVPGDLILNINRLKGHLSAEEVDTHSSEIAMRWIEISQAYREFGNDPLAALHYVVQSMGDYDISQNNMSSILNPEVSSGECEARAEYAYTMLNEVLGGRYPMKVQIFQDHVRLLIQIDGTYYAAEGDMPVVRNFSGTGSRLVDASSYILARFLNRAQLGTYYPPDGSQNSQPTSTTNPHHIQNALGQINTGGSRLSNYSDGPTPDRVEAQEPTEYQPRNNNLFVMLGRLEQDYPENETILSYITAVRQNPNDVDALMNLGWHLNEQERYAEAEIFLRRILDLDPNYIHALNNLGVSLNEQERYAEAEIFLRRILDLDPNYIHALNSLGVSLNGQERYAEAERSLMRALDLDPNYVYALNNLGVSLNGQERYAEAERPLRRILDLDPNYIHALNSLEVSLNEQERYAEAERPLRRILDLDRNYVYALNNLGVNLSQQSRHDEVVSLFSRLPLASLNSSGLEAYANALISLNRSNELDTFLTRLTELYPESQWDQDFIERTRNRLQ